MLKIDGKVEPKAQVKLGQTNYGEYLEPDLKVSHPIAKPIISTTSIEKKPAGQNWEGPINVSTIEHPGVFNQKNTACLIGLEGSITVNLGNFNSARFGVTITIPTDPENIAAAYSWGTSWVEAKITEAKEQIKP